MSVHCVREAQLLRDKGHLVLRCALNGLSAGQLTTPPSPCRPPTRDKRLLDNYLSWSHLDEVLLMHTSIRLIQGHQGGSEHAQLSYILLKLREEIPAFFHGHHSYDLYAPNMRYEVYLCRYPWQGNHMNSYRMFLTMSRLSMLSVYRGCTIDLLRITKDNEHRKIEARWRLRGRYPWTRRDRVILDGISEFKVDTQGLITMHRMSRLQPPRPLRTRAFNWLTALGPNRAQPEV